METTASRLLSGSASHSPNRSKAMRLIGMANELLAMAREIDAGSNSHPLQATRDQIEQMREDVLQSNNKDHPLWAELARQAYEDRRKRARVFNSEELFGEPAWDILLDLFIAAKEQRRVSVTSACIGAAVPPTTALRWISILEKHRLVTRIADPKDARRIYVELSTQGYTAMLEFFTSTSRSGASRFARNHFSRKTM